MNSRYSHSNRLSSIRETISYEEENYKKSAKVIKLEHEQKLLYLLFIPSILLVVGIAYFIYKINKRYIHRYCSSVCRWFGIYGTDDFKEAAKEVIVRPFNLLKQATVNKETPQPEMKTPKTPQVDEFQNMSRKERQKQNRKTVFNSNDIFKETTNASMLYQAYNSRSPIDIPPQDKKRKDDSANSGKMFFSSLKSFLPTSSTSPLQTETAKPNPLIESHTFPTPSAPVIISEPPTTYLRPALKRNRTNSLPSQVSEDLDQVSDLSSTRKKGYSVTIQDEKELRTRSQSVSNGSNVYSGKKWSVAAKNQFVRPIWKWESSESINELSLDEDNDSFENNLGKILIYMKYDVFLKHLIVRIVEARHLNQSDTLNRSGMDPYVTVQFLPNVHFVATTKTKRSTNNPVWKETFQFEQFPQDQLRSKNLKIKIFDKRGMLYSRETNDVVVGETDILLSKIKLDQLKVGVHFWKRLKYVQPEDCGFISLSTLYEERTKCMTVSVNQIKNVTVSHQSQPSYFVKCVCRNPEWKVKSQKSKVITDQTLCFREVFKVQLNTGMINQYRVIIQLCYKSFVSSTMIGWIQIGSEVGNDKCRSIWNEAIDNPYVSVEKTFRLISPKDWNLQ